MSVIRLGPGMEHVNHILDNVLVNQVLQVVFVINVCLVIITLVKMVVRRVIVLVLIRLVILQLVNVIVNQELSVGNVIPVNLCTGISLQELVASIVIVVQLVQPMVNVTLRQVNVNVALELKDVVVVFVHQVSKTFQHLVVDHVIVYLMVVYQISAILNQANACVRICLLYTSPSPRDQRGSRMPSSA